ILSGNRDISCATCHLPAETLGDGLSLSVGTRGAGAGHLRRLGAGRAFEPRNSPTLLNAGSIADSMVWDRRVRPGTGPTSNGTLLAPAGAALPGSVTDLLAAQAMMPVTSRLEMRGEVGDLDVLGNPNELAALGDTDFTGIWQGIMARLLAIPAYVTKF